ncbi:MAG: sugar-binding protein [Acidobacteriota bacterium]|nr:sugar-binding protein [Acidobacteriota bacterium]
MLRLVLALIAALAVVPCVQAEPVAVLLDTAQTLTGWGAEDGGEFPGAATQLSLTKDPERGLSVRSQVSFAGESRYGGVKWYGRIPECRAVGCWIKMVDRSWGMIRVRDATEQEHAGGFHVTPGQWTRVEIPIVPESFGNHWGGANDGLLHFPLRVVLFAAARGPDQAEILASDLFMVVDDPDKAGRWTSEISPGTPSGIAFPGEPSTYSVRVLNRLEQAAACRLSVSRQAIGGEPEVLLSRDITVAGWDAQQVDVPVPTGDIGYWRIAATMTDAGTGGTSETVSGLAVVPEPRYWGQFAPHSYFGMQHIQDMEAAERLGAKSVRIGPGWRWVEPRRGEVLWERHLDPRIQSAVEHGMSTLYTVEAIAPNWAAWNVPDKPSLGTLVDPALMDEWERFVRDIAARYGDYITALEIQNEPDLTCWQHPGLSFEEGVDYYAELLRRGHAGAKAGNPKVLVTGLDVSGGDFDSGLRYSRAVMAKAGDCLDLYTGHPYASPRYFGPGLHPRWPTDNRMAEKCRAALDMMEEFGRPRRMWVGELGWGVQATADPLSSYSLDFAACITQALITGKSVPGMEKFSYFTQVGCNEGGHEYGLLRGRPMFPLPAAMAYAACAWVLDGTEPVNAVDVTPEIRRFTFASKERDELVVVWWSDGETAAITPPDNAPAGIWYTGMLGRIADPSRGVQIGRLPVYWVLPLREVGENPAFLEEMGARVAVPVELRLAFQDTADDIGLLLANRAGKAETVTVTVDGAEREMTVPESGDPVRLRVPFPEGADKVRVTVTSGDRKQERTVSRLATPMPLPPAGVSVDGDLSEWQALEAFVVDRREDVLPPDPNVGWSGPADLSIRAWFAADERGLHFAAAVTDDAHAVPVTGLGHWMSDSVQIAIDPLNDSAEEFGPDDREVGLVDESGNARAYTSYPLGGAHPTGPVAVRRVGNETRYEALLTWDALGIARPLPGKVIAVNFIANDNDGQGRGYWMGLTPGIGEGKNPEAYREFVVSGR